MTMKLGKPGMKPIWQDKTPKKQDGKQKTQKKMHGMKNNALTNKNGNPIGRLGKPRMPDGGRSRNEAEARIEAFSVILASGDAGADRFGEGV